MTDNERNTEGRLRDALSAYTEQVEPADDAWGKIRAGVNAKESKRRTMFWSSLGLAGAAAAVVAVIGFAAVRSGDDGERVVANPGDDPKGFVALTTDGELRRFDPTGRDRGLITDTGWGPGANFSAPEISVAPDGTVYFSRATVDPACPRVEQLGSEIVSIPLEGGDPEIVVPVGTAPAVSPDGSALAYLTTESGEQCDSTMLETPNGPYFQLATRVELLDLASEDRSNPNITYPDPSGDSALTFRPEGPLAWSPDGDELATNVRCTTPDGSCEGAYTAIMSSAGGEARFVYEWGEGDGGPALAFADDTSVLVNTSEFGSAGSIGFMSSDVSDPAAAEAAALPQYISLPPLSEPESLSTLSGENDPGILAVLGSSGDAAGPSPRVAVYAEESAAAPVELAHDVVRAVWIPGTTADDVFPASTTIGAAELGAEVPIDTSYLPGVGFTKMLAADDAGVWVIVADDPEGGSSGVAHVSGETNAVDKKVDIPGVSSLLPLDDDLWFTSEDGVGRITADGSIERFGGFSEVVTRTNDDGSVEQIKSAGEELAATESTVWAADPVGNRLIGFDRETGATGDEYSTPGTPQEIVTLGDELWIEADGLGGALARLEQASGELVDRVALPERVANTYAVAGNTIWTIGAGGNLVPLVGDLSGTQPIPIDMENAVFTPRDSGLAVGGLGDTRLRLFDESGQPESAILDVPVTPFPEGADGPWGGMVISGNTAWWQNAAAPSLLRIDLVE